MKKEKKDFINKDVKKISDVDMKSALNEVKHQNRELRDSFKNPDMSFRASKQINPEYDTFEELLIKDKNSKPVESADNATAFRIIKPLVIERYADNGALSDYAVIDPYDGSTLWEQSEAVDEPTEGKCYTKEQVINLFKQHNKRFGTTHEGFNSILWNQTEDWLNGKLNND
jgi:hypothetical protein